MKIEFGLHTVEQSATNEALITGRVFFGTVRCGTQFSQACEIKHTTPDQIPIRQPVGKIDIIVSKITCYGREVDALEEGLTGSITVTGSGIGLLTPLMSIVATS
jgi:hypothetical protein